MNILQFIQLILNGRESVLFSVLFVFASTSHCVYSGSLLSCRKNVDSRAKIL